MFIDKRGNYVCRICLRASTRRSYRKHIEKRRAQARAYQVANPEKVRERMRAARLRRGEEYQEKRRARDQVKESLLYGRLTKGPCEHADSNCRGRIEAHHDDYSRPLEVRWLCHAHHRHLHGNGIL